MKKQLALAAQRPVSCPARSLSSRIARGLELLRTRLSRRDIALSTAALGTVLTEQGASAMAPAALVQATVQSGMLFLSGQASTAPAVLLTRQILTEMFLMKVKIFATVGMVAAALGLGVVFSTYGGTRQQPVAKAAAGQQRLDFGGDPLPADAIARLGTTRWRHGADISFAAYLNGDKELLTVSAAANGAVRVFDVASGKEVRSFGTRCTNAFLTADRKTLLTFSAEGNRVWDVATGKETRSFAFDPPIPPFSQSKFPHGFIVVSPDGKIAAHKSFDRYIRLYRTETGKLIRTLDASPPRPAGARPQSRQDWWDGTAFMAFTSDGKSLLTQVIDTSKKEREDVLKRFNIESGEVSSSIVIPTSIARALTPDGNTVILDLWNAHNPKNNTLSFHDLKSGKETLKIPTPGMSEHAFFFSPDGKIMASKGAELPDPNNVLGDLGLQRLGRAAGGGVLWDITTGKQVFQVPDGDSSAIAIAADGKSVAIARCGSTVSQWNIATGKELSPSSGAVGLVWSLAISGDGKTAITRAADDLIRVWNARTGEPVRQFSSPPGATLSADARTLASYADSVLIVWDAQTGKQIRQWKIVEEKAPEFVGSDLAISPDGGTIAFRNAGPIHLYDSSNGRERRVLTDSSVTELSRFVWSPDGTVLAAVGINYEKIELIGKPPPPMPVNVHIRGWDVRTGKPFPKIPYTTNDLTCLAFTADGRSLAIARADGTVSVCEVMSGKERCKFKAGPKGCANVIHWMPDGRTLLVAGEDGVIRIVQAPDGKELGQLKGHDTSIVSLALAGDGKTLVSGSADTTALVYDASRLPRADRPTTTIDAARFDSLWQGLALEDAGKAFQAGQTLASAGNATQFLENKVKPVTLDPKRIPQLITDLGVNDFQVRERAMKDLEKLGELAEVDLNRALQNKPSLELQQRAKQILARLAMHEAPPVEVLQMHRALEVLECLGTSDARRILQTVATGAPGASLTRAARAALDRLAKDKP